MWRTQFRDNIRVLQFITFTVNYIYRGSRVHIFRADIQFARFPSFFFYIDRNDAVEPPRQDFSRVIGALHLVWNDDKMINLCSFMRYFGQRNALHDPVVPIVTETINRPVCHLATENKQDLRILRCSKEREYPSRNIRKLQQELFRGSSDISTTKHTCHRPRLINL